MIRDASDLMKTIRRVAMGALSAINLPFRSKIDPSYASGNPKTQRPGEASAANVTKKALIACGSRLPVASDTIVEIPLGANGTAWAIIGDVPTTQDAQTWRNVARVKPGATNTEITLATEQSHGTTTFTTKKRWLCARPGRYRVVFDLRRETADSAEARVILITGSGDVVVASATESTASGTYVSKTLDMTLEVWGGAELGLQIRNTGAGSAFVQSLVVKWDTATADPTLAATSLQD